MRKFLWCVLYTALALAANPTLAGTEGLEALKTGDMQKLMLTEPAKTLPEVELLDVEDGTHSLKEYAGSWVVLNFWATWCMPCREEMPALGRLQIARPDLKVVTVATGRNEVAGILRFCEEAGVTHLTVLRDPDMELAHGVGIMGLPVTLILNPAGEEVARLIGEADWAAPEALAVLDALMAE